MDERGPFYEQGEDARRFKIWKRYISVSHWGLISTWDSMHFEWPYPLPAWADIAPHRS